MQCYNKTFIIIRREDMDYMKTVVFINEKGGVGKTSLCFNTAWEISKHKKVLLIDFDGQRANLSYFCNIKKSEEMKTIYEVLMENVDIRESIQNIKDNLDIIPANDIVSSLGKEASIPSFLQALRSIREKYDYCFMDVSPSPNRGQALALSASDYVIIPMLPEVTALEANMGVMDTIMFIKEKLNPNIKVLGFLFNKNESRTNLSKDVQDIAEKMAKKLDTTIFETKIKDTVLLKENVGAHKGITGYDLKSNAAFEYVCLCNEIEHKIFGDKAFDYIEAHYNELEQERIKYERERAERLQRLQSARTQKLAGMGLIEDVENMNKEVVNG